MWWGGAGRGRRGGAAGIAGHPALGGGPGRRDRESRTQYRQQQPVRGQTAVSADPHISLHTPPEHTTVKIEFLECEPSPSSMMRMGDNTNNNTQSIADYLAQLLKDKKQLAAFPNVFVHMERLLDDGELIV